jgi:hypothetical protein
MFPLLQGNRRGIEWATDKPSRHGDKNPMSVQISVPNEERSSTQNVLRFRCPPSLPVVVRRAASRQLLSVSSYLRRATLEQLRRDGIELRCDEGADAQPS